MRFLSAQSTNRKLAAADVLRVVTAVAAHYNTLQPTPELLGVNVAGVSLLESMVPSGTVESMLDKWLQMTSRIWKSGQAQIKERIDSAVAKDKDIGTLCAILEKMISGQRQACDAAAALAGSYAGVWSKLAEYEWKVMKDLTSWLTNLSTSYVCGDDGGAKDLAMAAVQKIWLDAATSIVRETFIPLLKFPASITDRVPGSEVKFTLDANTIWVLQTIKIFKWRPYDEGLRCEVLKMVATFLELFFALETSVFEGWMTVGKEIGDAVQSLANTVTGGRRGTPLLAVKAFDANCRVLALPKAHLHLSQLSKDAPPIRHDEGAYIRLVGSLPSDVVKQRFQSGKDLEDFVAHLRDTVQEDKKNDGKVIKIIQQLPRGLLEPIVKAALVPGGALDCLATASQEALHPFADLDDRDMKKALQKATDTSVPHRRMTALHTLVACAKRSESAEQLASALSFVAKRIQNETAQNRENVLSLHVLGDLSKVLSIMLHKDRVSGDGVMEDKHTSVWLRLVDDFTQAPDSEDAGSMLQYYFTQAGNSFLTGPIHLTDSAQFYYRKFTAIQRAWMELGAEILWRISDFSKGTKKARTEWEVPITTGFEMVDTTPSQIGFKGAAADIGVVIDNIKFLHGLYTSRVDVDAEPETETEEATLSSRHMSVASSATSENTAASRAVGRELRHFGNLVQFSGQLYPKIPLLDDKIKEVVSMAAGECSKAIRAHIHIFIGVVQATHTKTCPWQQSPLLRQYYDSQLRKYGTSRPELGGENLLKNWLSMHLSKDAKRKERQQRRATAATTVSLGSKKFHSLFRLYHRSQL
jgi:hypothetical protein